MENAAEILVIILSVFLALFLLVHIILAVLFIKLVQTLKHLAEQADIAVDNVREATGKLKGVAGPLVAGKFLVNLVEMINNRKGKK